MQLRTEIEISAPPQKVWEVLVDLEHYAEWNPLITHAEGTLEVGERLQLNVSQPRGHASTIRFTVVKLDAPLELRWRSRFISPVLFQSEQFFLLQETAGGGTKLIHGTDFRGFLAKRYSVMLPSTARGFAHMNQALKDKVEGRPRRRARARKMK